MSTSANSAGLAIIADDEDTGRVQRGDFVLKLRGVAAEVTPGVIDGMGSQTGHRVLLVQVPGGQVKLEAFAEGEIVATTTIRHVLAVDGLRTGGDAPPRRGGRS